jgi:hypothetical protein
VRPAATKAPPVIVAEAEENFQHSIDFAEQYLRSQGELDLQIRLGKMSSQKSLSQKNHLSEKKSGNKDSKSDTARKLGLSVGELELVTRLQQYRKRHSSEAV